MSGGLGPDEATRLLAKTLRSIMFTHPFFGTLALFADYRFDSSVETAATDGATIWISPEYAAGLDRRAFGGLILHELLHCALDHVPRRRWREPYLWNIAADIVVNGMIRSAANFLLPQGSVQDWKLEHLSVEEVYERVHFAGASGYQLTLTDVRSDSGLLLDSAAPARASYWRNAVEQALVVARRRDQAFGATPLGRHRELAQLHDPQLAWRDLLWRFVARTPTDFAGFDRRFLWRGLYLDGLEQEAVNLKVAIDTSGSIDETTLSEFTTEISAVLRAYPRVEGIAFFADAELHGPYPLDQSLIDRRPEGGGGTSFQPFFEALGDFTDATDLCIYFTDGFGSFPGQPPQVPVLWVVTPGGLESEQFPFGDVARMSLAAP